MRSFQSFITCVLLALVASQSATAAELDDLDRQVKILVDAHSVS
jgi:hypothetical protein